MSVCTQWRRFADRSHRVPFIRFALSLETPSVNQCCRIANDYIVHIEFVCGINTSDVKLTAERVKRVCCVYKCLKRLLDDKLIGSTI